MHQCRERGRGGSSLGLSSFGSDGVCSQISHVDVPFVCVLCVIFCVYTSTLGPPSEAAARRKSAVEQPMTYS